MICCVLFTKLETKNKDASEFMRRPFLEGCVRLYSAKSECIWLSPSAFGCFEFIIFYSAPDSLLQHVFIRRLHRVYSASRAHSAKTEFIWHFRANLTIRFAHNGRVHSA